MPPSIARRCALIVLLLAQASAAHADPAPPDTTSVALVVDPDVAIPSNGGILITSIYDPSAIVERSTMRGVPIDGLLSPLTPLLFVWTPRAPLAPGLYTVVTQALSTGPVTEQEITVILGLDLNSVEVSVAPTVMEVNNVMPNICCDDGTLFVGQCFPDTIYRQLLLTLNGDASAQPEVLHQLMFRALDPARPEDRDLTGFRRAIELPILQVAYYLPTDELCFDVEIQDIATRMPHLLSDLGTVCVPRGSFGVPGSEPVDADDSELDRLACPRPPEPLHDRWCDVNAAACDGLDATEAAANGCRFYDYDCHNGPWPPFMATGAGGMMSMPPSFPDAGTSNGGEGGAAGSMSTTGATGTAGMAAMAGAPANEEPALPTAAQDAPRSSGCAVSSTPSANSDRAVVMLASLLALSVSRVRRRRID